MKRYLTAIILTSLLCSLASCQDTPVSEETTTAGADASETTAAVYPLPEKDFGGETITFYTRWNTDGWDWNVSDLIAAEQNGEPLNDAVYERNRRVEERYNVTIAQCCDGKSNDVASIRSILLAGDDTYPALIMSGRTLGSLGQEQLLYDLFTLDNIDPHADYWNPNLTNALTIGGKLYYTMGDLSATDNRAVRCLMFNKDLIRDYKLDDPYVLVKNGTWTFDTFFGMVQTVNTDLDGNGSTDNKDLLGLYAQPSIGENLYYASGRRFTVKNNEDLLETAFNQKEHISVMQNISERIRDAGKALYLSNDYQTMIPAFAEGHSLFYSEVSLFIERMRQYEFNVGMLPMPKYDAAQKDYCQFADGFCLNFAAIPVTNAVPEDTALLLEALSYESQDTLTPAYYDICLTGKAIRDEESLDMLDIIFNNYIIEYSDILNLGIISSFSKPLAGEGEIASAAASIAVSADQKIAEINAKLKK